MTNRWSSSSLCRTDCAFVRIIPGNAVRDFSDFSLVFTPARLPLFLALSSCGSTSFTCGLRVLFQISCPALSVRCCPMSNSSFLLYVMMPTTLWLMIKSVQSNSSKNQGRTGCAILTEMLCSYYRIMLEHCLARLNTSKANCHTNTWEQRTENK